MHDRPAGTPRRFRQSGAAAAHDRHGVAITLAPRERRPFTVDAMVVEDDTWSILASSPEFRPATEHPIRLMQSLYEAEPDTVGTVLVTEGSPLLLRAIVHDLDCDPSWRPEWISTAWREILRIAEARNLRSIGSPLLGRRFGPVPRPIALSLLDDALASRAHSRPERLWLLEAPDSAVDH